MSRRYFGTDGIRGKVGAVPITPEFFYHLGKSWAETRLLAGDRSGSVVLTARDTRQSGIALEKAFASGVEKTGLSHRSLGVVPTPVLCWQMGHLGAGSAAMLTASHNPATDNGIKFFLPPGRKLTTAEEAELESRLEFHGDCAEWAPVEPSGSFGDGDFTAFEDEVLKNFADLSLKGVRVALDTANGATGKIAPETFRWLGAELFTIGDSPDGQNINAGVGSEHSEALRELIRLHHCDVGVAFDGDGDRVLIIDRDGRPLDGDELLYILTVSAHQRGDLPGDKVVATVQSNVGLDQSLAAHGIKVLRVPVGDRWVSEAMQAEGLRWGGESSGHLICGTYQWTGDGLVAALSALRIWRETGGDWQKAAKGFERVPQLSGKLAVRAKPPLESLPLLNGALAEAEAELSGRGRVMLRYSGTEAVLRILVEAPTIEIARVWYRRLESLASKEIGT